MRLSYATFDNNGHPISHEEEFDMVVLSVGLKPTPETKEIQKLCGIKSFYPDFVIVRKSGKGFIVDILEPHDDTRMDTLPKAIGLAKFSEAHGDLFGHLVISRMKGDKWQSADMNDKAARKKIKDMQPQSDLENLFG